MHSQSAVLMGQISKSLFASPKLNWNCISVAQARQELEKIRRKLEAELAEVHHQLEEAKMQIQDLEALVHKKDMELNDLNARLEYVSCIKIFFGALNNWDMAFEVSISLHWARLHSTSSSSLWTKFIVLHCDRVDEESARRSELEKKKRELENQVEELKEDVEAEKAGRAKEEKKRRELAEVWQNLKRFTVWIIRSAHVQARSSDW